MAPEEAAMRCLAVCVMRDKAGDIDSLELARFMNEVAGPDQWISTSEWLFVEPPQSAPEQVTAPVALPEEVAVKAILNDLTNDPQRILTDHAMTPGEIRKWRFLAFQVAPNPQGQGLFPWEAMHA